MVNKLYLAIVFMCVSTLYVQAQESALYTVPVSDVYYAKVYLEDVNVLSSQGWIGVFDKKSDKELIRVASEDLFVDYDEEGNPSVNVIELPYGSQSVIIYDDFNFDGIKDFALRDGNMSCYSGPSYRVYLADGKGGFVYDDGFTDLAQSYCGFFSVDYDKKRIYTMSKSGCCSHWFNTFDVADNKPRIRKEVEEILSFNIPFIMHKTITTWDVMGKKNVKNEDLLYMEDSDATLLFSFNLKDKARKVMLIDAGEMLYYVFAKQSTEGDSIAEFCYPYYLNVDDSQPQELTYNLINNSMETLTFSNTSADYKIYNTKNSVGIKVTTAGKVYDMKGDPATRNVTYFFDTLEGVGYENLNFDADTRLDSAF